MTSTPTDLVVKAAEHIRNLGLVDRVIRLGVDTYLKQELVTIRIDILVPCDQVVTVEKTWHLSDLRYCMDVSVDDAVRWWLEDVMHRCNKQFRHLGPWPTL